MMSPIGVELEKDIYYLIFKCQKCGRGRDYFETDVQIAFSKHKTDFKYPSTFEQVRKKELRN